MKNFMGIPEMRVGIERLEFRGMRGQFNANK